MNRKSISERINNIMNRGPEKWLSRSLHESALENRKSDHEELIKQIHSRTNSSNRNPRNAPLRIKSDAPSNSLRNQNIKPTESSQHGLRMSDNLRDTVNSYNPGDELHPEDEDAIRTERRKQRRNRTNNSNDSKALGSLLRAPDSKESTERSKTLKPSSAPTFTTDDGDVVQRRADTIFNAFGSDTELPGEAAAMQAIFGVLNNREYDDIVQHLNVKPGSAAYKRLPEETRNKIEEFHKTIDDVLPTDYRDGGWEHSAARMAKLVNDKIRESMDDGEDMSEWDLMKVYESDPSQAMRLNNMDGIEHLDPYTQMFNMMVEKIGGADRLKEVLNVPAGRNVSDYYDPTDITVTRRGKAAEMIDEFGTRLSNLNVNPEDISTDEMTAVLNLLNDYKKELMESGDLLPFSLKKLKNTGDGKLENVVQQIMEFIPKPINHDFGMGTRNLPIERQAGATNYPQFDFLQNSNNFEFELPDGRTITMPQQIHPGGSKDVTDVNGTKEKLVAKLAQDPHGSLGTIRAEPKATGMGAKMKAIPINTWFDEVLNSYVPGLADSVGGLYDNLGIDTEGSSNALRALSDDDVQGLTSLVERLQNHEGNFAFDSSQMNFNIAGQNYEPEEYFKKLQELDSIIDSNKGEGILDREGFDDDESIDGDMRGDRLARTMTREGRDLIRQLTGTDGEDGSLPLSQIRQKIRAKLASLKYTDLFQQLESAGPEVLNRFVQEMIYNPAKSVQEGQSPHMVLM